MTDRVVIPGWPGLAASIEAAVEIAEEGIPGMFVTHSPDGEYTSSYDVEATLTDT